MATIDLLVARGIRLHLGRFGVCLTIFPGVQETQARLRVELKYQDSLELLTYSLQNLILTGQSSCNHSGGMFAFESLQS